MVTTCAYARAAAIRSRGPAQPRRGLTQCNKQRLAVASESRLALAASKHADQSAAREALPRAHIDLALAVAAAGSARIGIGIASVRLCLCCAVSLIVTTQPGRQTQQRTRTSAPSWPGAAVALRGLVLRKDFRF